MKPFNALGFFKEIRVPFTTTHHHCSPGWVNIHCPFCPASEGKNYHLGVETSSGRVNCWRCGGHSLWDLIHSLTRESVKKVLERFGSGLLPSPIQPIVDVPRPAKLSLPPGTVPLNERHHQYLKTRGFDSPRLEREWGLLGTQYRIIIPVFKDGEMVSYTSRDITGRSPIRYKNCPTKDEVFPLKHSLYGLDKVVGDTVIVMEGPTDVWRFGYGAVATFGIQWTEPQSHALLQFKRIFILFDKEPQAQKQAHLLAEELSWVVDEVCVLSGIQSKDPGEMLEEEVTALRNETL